MHWERVIREDDNPEWIGVVHADGTLSEVKIGVFGDEVHIHIKRADSARVHVYGGGAHEYVRFNERGA